MQDFAKFLVNLCNLKTCAYIRTALRSIFHVTSDYIDLAKMAQLLPVIGAAVGAVANYQLLKQLGDTAMNCYRMRHFAAEEARQLPQ